MDSSYNVDSIAVIATAGASLSRDIYDLAATTGSGAATDIARATAELSIIVAELHRVLSNNGAKICSRSFLREGVEHAMQRICQLHDEVGGLTKESSAAELDAELDAVHQKVAQADGYKTAVHLMLNVILLATAARHYQELPQPETQGQEDQANAKRQDIRLLRQQSELLSYLAYQSVVRLSYDTGGQSSRQGQDDDARLPHNMGEKSDDTALWLFGLVFPTHLNSRTEATGRNNGHTFQQFTSAFVSAKQSIVNEPRATVGELLADWTRLSEEEIASVTGDKPETTAQEGTETDGDAIRLKDATGRSFRFPYHRVKTWPGMEDLIKEAFSQDKVLGDHVKEGHYDLLDESNGCVILSSLWQDTVQPGLEVTMTMWPADRLRPPPNGIASPSSGAT